MVGNIRLMKKLMPTRQKSPALPTMQIAPMVQRAAPMPKRPSILRELRYFISMVEMKRLARKRHIATILYVCAVALLMPRLSAYWMMKVHTIICAAT